MSLKRSEARSRYYIREQSIKRGWNPNHVSKGGHILEEQEIMNYFKDIGLNQARPDFLFCLHTMPVMVIEAKNEASKINIAIAEAIEYAEVINKNSNYKIKIAVGAAGEETQGFVVEVRYLKNEEWVKLTSRDHEITTIPSKQEVITALLANNATTNVEVPSIAEFIDAAIELSKILRLAKVEAPLRPKVIGALTLAMYQGEINVYSENVLNDINTLISEAIYESVDLDADKKERLLEALKLLGADYNRLNPYISRIVYLMRRLNIKAVLQTDTDFLGLFYEAFLRYGYDNNALGIVFTPRHITRFCANLVKVKPTDRVVDLACGTGGFLVAAFDKMLKEAYGPKAIQKVKKALYGFDTNPTIWALATLNMFFRGDGKSHIKNSSCFDNLDELEELFTKAFLNPPFSQEGEPEREFINASIRVLEPEGLLVCVVKSGIFADEENAAWRKEFTRNHQVIGMISLPDDLFYPTAAPTSILIAKAHIPQKPTDNVFMARIWNDGYVKLKGRRVEVDGSQLDITIDAFENFTLGNFVTGENYFTISAENILLGAEWSPHQWLPQPITTEEKLIKFEKQVKLSIFQAISAIPECADVALEDFGSSWQDFPPLIYNKSDKVSFFFKIENGKSSGEKNYQEGAIPYISSGDLNNSIIRLVEPDEYEVFEYGGITVTAFGQASVQPWPFVARGNGGSSVRVLLPRYKMSFNELIWFASQINAQKWRIFYARMSIKSRLENLIISSPPSKILDKGDSIFHRIDNFKKNILEFGDL